MIRSNYEDSTNRHWKQTTSQQRVTQQLVSPPNMGIFTGQKCHHAIHKHGNVTKKQKDLTILQPVLTRANWTRPRKGTQFCCENELTKI